VCGCDVCVMCVCVCECAPVSDGRVRVRVFMCVFVRMLVRACVCACVRCVLQSVVCMFVPAPIRLGVPPAAPGGPVNLPRVLLQVACVLPVARARSSVRGLLGPGSTTVACQWDSVCG
jgi:hypothetical protein